MNSLYLYKDRFSKRNKVVIILFPWGSISHRRLTPITDEKTKREHTTPRQTWSQMFTFHICFSKGPFIFLKSYILFPKRPISPSLLPIGMAF